VRAVSVFAAVSEVRGQSLFQASEELIEFWKLMTGISTTRLENCTTEHTAEEIRRETARFADLLTAVGVPQVRVWCSWNPDLPDDSPLQSPDEIIPPHRLLDFLDTAVKNGVWKYGDNWNRAGVEGIDGTFKILFTNDKTIVLETEDRRLLDATRANWIHAGYEVFERDGRTWNRIHPPLR
jgi:hypothetical protein